jgi:hypothetical protein
MSVEIEIGDNLYLQIYGETLTPGKQGYTSGAPEDCYESEPAELEWCGQQLVKYMGKAPIFYICEEALADCYYDELLDQALEDFDKDLSDRILQKYEDRLLEKMEGNR